jgi:hypothetical protein
VAEYEPGAFQFGVWSGPASPMRTSGTPDQVVAYVAGQGEYQATRSQTLRNAPPSALSTDRPGPRFPTLPPVRHGGPVSRGTSTRFPDVSLASWRHLLEHILFLTLLSVSVDTKVREKR